MHQLTIAEIPSHNHVSPAVGQSNWYPTFGKNNVITNGLSSGEKNAYGGFTSSTGGNQAHNIMPRFMTLAYVMKL